MPLYEYKCLKCARRTEKIESVAGPHLSKCPHCGGKVESVLSAPAIQFKGAGWYVTDYAGKGKSDSSSASGEKTEKPAAETKEPSTSANGSAAKDSTTKESKDKKPAKKK